MIAVVDYHKGNLKSVERGLVGAGARDVRVTDNPVVLRQASTIVLPGVGAYADAAQTMRELGQIDVVRERVRAGVPFLGICLGMHLLFEGGVENASSQAPAPGLGLLLGIVGALPRVDAAGNTYKIPHVGWNTVEYVQPQAGEGTGEGTRDVAGEGARASDATSDATSDAANAAASVAPLFAGIPNNEYFYFTHSFAVPESAATIARTTHAEPFPCAVRFGACAYGVQFHPEKSSDAGMRLLQNFVHLAKEA